MRKLIIALALAGLMVPATFAAQKQGQGQQTTKQETTKKKNKKKHSSKKTEKKQEGTTK